MLVCTLTGKSILQIFREEGETAFRRAESRVLAELGKRSGIILATGGGCVTVPENRSLLRQNGRVIWIQRAIEELPTKGRPLSQTSSLYDMYERRAPLYERSADIVISNNGPIDDTVRSVIHHLEETE